MKNLLVGFGVERLTGEPRTFKKFEHARVFCPRRRTAQCALWALFTLVWPFPQEVAAGTLRILHTNDIHAHLVPFRTSSGDTLGGLARLATLVQRERAAAPASVYFDAGDLFQGTPFYNFFKGEAELRVLSAIGCDAMAMGNHELDDGPRNLRKQVREHARFPVLSANVWMKDSTAVRNRDSTSAGWTVVSPVVTAKPTFIDVQGIKIGLIGVTTEDIPNIVARKNSQDLIVNRIADAVGDVDYLRERSDLVVVLSHCGLAADSVLAATVPGIDVIVSGHDHKAVPVPILVKNPKATNGIGGTLLVETGDWGRNLGRLDLELDDDGRLIGWEGQLLPVTPDIPEDSTVAALIAEYQRKIEPLVSRVIAVSTVPLPYDSVMHAETALGNMITDVIRAAAGTDVAFQNGGGIRSSLPEGDIRISDVYSLLPFENTIVTVRLSGYLLEDFCREMVGKRGAGGFGPVSGLTFQVVEGRPVDIKVGGKPLDHTLSYTIATNNFTASGGDGYTLFRKGSRYEDTGTLLRDVVIGALERARTVSPRLERRVRFR